MEEVNDKKVLDIVKSKRLFLRYVNLTVALFLCAVSFNLFLNPFHLVAGGTGGVATILDYIWGIKPANTIFILSALLTLTSILFLELDYSLSMVYVTFIYPYFVKITASINSLVMLNTDDMFIIAIFGGIVTGIANGIIYKNGLSSGGINVVSKILYNRKKMSITKANFIINAIIVLFGSYIFGLEMLLYAIIYLYISSLIANKIMLGTSKKKSLYIITDKYKEVKELIIKKMNHGITIYDAIGGKDKENKKTIMTVIPTREYKTLKEIVDDIDSKAFIVAVDSYEVKGGY